MTAPTNLSIATPEASAIALAGQRALSFVEDFEVVDDATYALAGEEMNAWLRRASQLTEQRMSITRPIDEAKSRVMDLFRAPVETLERAAAIVKRKMIAYSDGVKRAAAEERLKLERAAEAERQRLAAEAAALAAAGRSGEAEVKRQVATMVVAQVPVVQSVPKVAGVSERGGGFDFEVDVLALATHIVSKQPELIGLLTFDSKLVRAHIVSLGVSNCKTPGVKVTPKTTLAGSRK